VTCLLALGVGATAAGTDSELTFNLRDETAPAGTMVQMKLEETVVTPISGGRPRMRLGPGLTVAGVAIIARDGELAGAAVPEGDSVAITFVSTASGSGGEYPVMTVSLRLDPDLEEGTEIPVVLDPSTWTINGAAIGSRAAEATVTVGGSLSITRVVPGEGFFPAGTLVTIHGTGFEGDIRLRLNGDTVVEDTNLSDTEIQFTLPEAMNLAGAELRLDHRDTNERVFYYSYLRGTPAAISQRALLSTLQPVFSGVTRSAATFGPIPALNSALQYAALALQNPNLEPVEIALDLHASDGTLVESAARSLPSGHRLVLEVSELFDGLRTPRGGFVRVRSSPAVEAFGLIVDERTRSVTPRLMIDAPPRPPRQRGRPPRR
jgi:hypothetical protein